MSRIKLSIDDREIFADEDQTILEAAIENGIYIPHLCYHENLHPSGGCRLCVVKQKGVEGVITSCSTKVQENMVIRTNDETAEKVRKLSVDFMFKTHPDECTGCPKYGKCQLQSISQYVGDTGRNLRPMKIRVGSDVRNPLILHEMYRCILCGRCVRACNEMRGVGAIKFDKIDGRWQVVINGKDLKAAGCKFCGACVEVCPTGSIRDQMGVIKEGVTREKALIPCMEGCPAGINIPKYIRFLREGNYPAATAVVREKAPFPEILGYICTHNCEMVCKRNYLNEAVSIRNLKRFAASKDDGSWKKKSYQKAMTGKKVGIIGSGPTGLTTAYYLAKSGHEVTIFEKLPQAGGMMRYGIPSYRLPREVLDKEIEEIRDVGVIIRYNSPIASAEELLRKGYDAVLVSIGSHKGVKLPLKGADLKGVHVNADFLRSINLGNYPTIGEKVVVLGGGNVAVDCTGNSIRLGAKEVYMVCLESKDKMTASKEEISWLLEEGATILNSRTFEEITGENGKVTGLAVNAVKEFYFDEKGEAVIEKKENSYEVIPADTIIFAVGQRPDITEEFGLELGRGNRVVINEKTMETSMDGVFAAGDVVTGTTSVIKVISSARIAAENIDRYLDGDGNIDETLTPDQQVPVYLRKEEGFVDRKRNEPEVMDASQRIKNFKIMDFGFCEETMKCEADRCLQCDLRVKIAPQKFWSDYAKEEGGDK